MEHNNIKVHPPWYARGTPVTKPRDGPPMAKSDKQLFVIREGPSARGKPKDFNLPWLTLKTTFFNTQNSVYGQWCAQIRQLADVKIIAMAKIMHPKTQRVDKIIEKNDVGIFKPRRGEMIINQINEWRKYHPVGFPFHIVIHAIIITSAKSGLK
jgi:hypothetical protein